MKRISTLFSFMLLSAFSHAQITISSSDVPVPSAIFHIDNFSANAPASPTIGNNQNWDYSTYFGNVPMTNNYPVETSTFFTASGIDVRYDGTKAFNAGFNYNISTEYDFNSTAVLESGVFVPAQAYELSSFTGSTADSLVIPAQQYILNAPKKVMEFPMTMNTTWQSTSARQTNFTLTVGAYSLNHTPALHKYIVNRTDSIIGWGKLRVHTPTGASAPIDVLMDKIAQYAVDSFYLAGAPAPTALLTAFNVTQGQQTDVQYAYNFYRKGSFHYLMRLNYGSDNTYTTMTGAWANTDNVAPSAIDEVNNSTYTTLIYPNPTKGHEMNILVQGKEVNEATFILSDLNGRMIQQGNVIMNGKNTMKILFSEIAHNGLYQLKVMDETTHEIISEKIQID